MADAPGLLASLRGFGATGIALARTRLELLKVETHEELDRILGLVFWGIAAVLLSVVGLSFLAVFLTVLAWEGYRLLALGLFAALFLVAALVAWSITRRLKRQESQLFAGSLAELRHDEALLRRGGAPDA